jgi:hypothetical protein
MKLVKKPKTHILCLTASFKKSVFYEIMWKNMVELDRPQIKMHCVLETQGYKHALRICNTYACRLQQWLHGLALMLCYKYTACLIIYLLVEKPEGKRPLGRPR